MKLDPSQEEAVRFFDGPCMVLAGPGSGKTTVIVNRVVNLTEVCGVPEEHILVVTFTRAAAEEMKKRYLALAGKSATTAAFGTIHAVFYSILREHYRLGPHAVRGEGERLRLLSEALRETDPNVPEDRELMKTILQAVSYVKSHGLDGEKFDAGIREVKFGKVYRAYEERLRKNGALDFDDLLTMTLKLFQEKSEALERAREKFQYLLVDEFQDVNPVQYEALRLIAAPRNNLFVVGDDDQSIYGFRGARPEVMLSFPKAYPDAKKIALSVNYRSGREIVKAAGRLIEGNRARFAKKIRAHDGAGLVRIRSFETDVAENAAVTEEIIDRIQSGVLADRLAVLTRTNAGMGGILRSFTEHSVPFYTRDRVPNPFQHFSAGPVFACLNFLAGNRTRANLFRFMNCPWRGLLREDFREETVDLKSVAKECASRGGDGFAAEKIRALESQLAFMQTLKTPFAMIHYFRNYMGYDRYLKEQAEKKNADAEALLAALSEVHESSRPYKTTEDWYRFIACFTRELKKQAEEEGRNTEGRVTVSTLHAAKGLEYQTVWILDVNERVIPHEKAGKPEELEEERRLLYVGMTRASEELFLCTAKTRFSRAALPSRFLTEIGL